MGRNWTSWSEEAPTGMTVGELIELLEDYEADTPVYFLYDYGDHANTRIASAVREVDEVEIAYSAYHRDDAVITDEDEEEDDRPADVRTVLGIS